MKTLKHASTRIALIGTVLLLALSPAACGTLTIGVEKTAVPAATSTEPSTAANTPAPTEANTAQPTAEPTTAGQATVQPTQAKPTLTPPAAPSATRPRPTFTPVPPPATVAPATTGAVKVALIAIDDGGKSGKAVGCGDSVVLVDRQITPTQGPLKAALQELFSIHTQFLGQSGLYTALYQSDLKVDSAIIKDGKATIKLSGTLKLGGVCDNPRVSAQILETAKQFGTVNQVEVTINGVPLSEALSLKG